MVSLFPILVFCLMKFLTWSLWILRTVTTLLRHSTVLHVVLDCLSDFWPFLLLNFCFLFFFLFLLSFIFFLMLFLFFSFLFLELFFLGCFFLLLTILVYFLLFCVFCFLPLFWFFSTAVIKFRYLKMWAYLYVWLQLGQWLDHEIHVETSHNLHTKEFWPHHRPRGQEVQPLLPLYYLQRSHHLWWPRKVIMYYNLKDSNLFTFWYQLFIYI